MLNKTVFTILSLLFCLQLVGQEYYIEGFVSFRGIPIDNANVIDIKTNKSTTTDKKGFFKLFVDTIQPYQLRVEAKGYIDQIIEIEKNNIYSDSNVQSLNYIPLEPIFEQTFNNNFTSQTNTNITKTNLIQTAAPTLSDAISQVCGVWMLRPQYMNNSISIRGMTGNRNTVYLDGIPLNHSMLSTHPNGLLNLVNMFEVQSIDVTKGGSTVKHGDGSLGGVINITTASPDYFEHGFNAEFFGSTRISNSREFLINGGSEIATENFAVRYGLSVHSIGDIGNQSPTGYDQFGGHLKGFAYLGRSRLEFGYNGTANLNRSDIYPTVFGLYTKNKLQDQDRQMAYVKFNKVVRKGLFRIIQAKAAYQRFHEQIREPLSTYASYGLENTNNSGWLNLTGTSNLGEGWKMDTGLEFKQEFVNSFAYTADSTAGITPINDGTYLNDANYTNLSLYNIHKIHKSNWDFEVGIRGNWINLQGYFPFTNLIQVRSFSVAGNTKAVYQINPNHQLIANINSNYRTPTFEQFVYEDFDLNTTDTIYFPSFNPNLSSEHSINFELAYRVMKGRFNAQIALYHNQLFNTFVVTTALSSDFFPNILSSSYENLGRGYVQGVELDVDAILSNSFKVTGNLTYTYGRDLYYNEYMRYIPPVNGTINLLYQYKNKLTSSLTYQFAGMQSNYASSKFFARLPEEMVTSSWNVLNFSIGYQWKELNISGGIRNIFDSNYRLYGSNIDEYRRNIWLGVRYQM